MVRINHVTEILLEFENRDGAFLLSYEKKGEFKDLAEKIRGEYVQFSTERDTPISIRQTRGEEPCGAYELCDDSRSLMIVELGAETGNGDGTAGITRRNLPRPQFDQFHQFMQTKYNSQQPLKNVDSSDRREYDGATD